MLFAIKALGNFFDNKNGKGDKIQPEMKLKQSIVHS